MILGIHNISSLCDCKTIGNLADKILTMFFVQNDKVNTTHVIPWKIEIKFSTISLISNYHDFQLFNIDLHIIREMAHTLVCIIFVVIQNQHIQLSLEPVNSMYQLIIFSCRIQISNWSSLQYTYSFYWFQCKFIVHYRFLKCQCALHFETYCFLLSDPMQNISFAVK